MRTHIDPRLIEEAAEFRLRYTCEDCGHFESAVERCSLGYPERPHRLVPLQVDQTLVFCKEFDLV